MEMQSRRPQEVQRRIPKRELPKIFLEVGRAPLEVPSPGPAACIQEHLRKLFDDPDTLDLSRGCDAGELQFQKTLQHSWVLVSLRWPRPTGVSEPLRLKVP